MFDNAIFLQFQHPSSFSVSPILLFPFLSFILLLLLTDIHMTICIQVKWECVYHFKTLSTPSHKYISTLLSSDKTSAALASFSLPLCLSLSLSLRWGSFSTMLSIHVKHTSNRGQISTTNHCKNTKLCMRKRGELSSVMGLFGDIIIKNI